MLFTEKYGWEELRRGRRPNAGVYGKIGKYHSSIQIESIEVDWNNLPDHLFGDMEFTLWCSASKKIDEIRLFCDTELYWKTTFNDLLTTTKKFTVVVNEMLCDIIDERYSFAEWPGVSINPDIGPEYGLPRKRT
jgi:hypothetical protein